MGRFNANFQYLSASYEAIKQDSQGGPVALG